MRLNIWFCSLIIYCVTYVTQAVKKEWCTKSDFIISGTQLVSPKDNSLECEKVDLRGTPSSYLTVMFLDCFSNSAMRFSAKEIYLSGNKFSGLFTEFLDLNWFNGFTALEKTDFSNCDAMRVDAPSTTFLVKYTNISHNRISEIPTSILVYPELVELDISYNSISHIYTNAFQDCKKVQYLDLSNNKLGTISRNTFQHLNELTELNLNDNVNLNFNLATDNPFTNTPKLKTLHLKNIDSSFQWCSSVLTLQQYQIQSTFPLFDNCCSSQTLCTSHKDECHQLTPGMPIRKCQSCNSGYESDVNGVCQAVGCPLNSQGTDVVSGNCVCILGYKPIGGPILPSTIWPFYTGSCQVVDCPAHSVGTNVLTGDCKCEAGYEPTDGNIVPSLTPPYHNGYCKVVVCPANSQGTNVVSRDCKCKAGYEPIGGEILPITTPPYHQGSCNAAGCPQNSHGTDVISNCYCNPGFHGSIIGIVGPPFSTQCTECKKDITNCNNFNETSCNSKLEKVCLTCKSGYVLDKTLNLCEDENECKQNNGGCDYLTTCINNIGAPNTCTNCPSLLFRGNGINGCVAKCNVNAFIVSASNILIKNETNAFVEQCVYLDLSSKNLVNLQDGLFNNFSKLTFLSLLDNTISHPPKNVFDHLNLKLDSSLLLDNLTKCSILGFDLVNGTLSRKIDPLYDYITDCPSLNLSNYSITSLAGNVFNDMNSLTQLDLTKNNISFIPEQVMDDLSGLDDMFLHLDLKSKCSVHYGFQIKKQILYRKKTKQTSYYGYLNKCLSLDFSNVGLRALSPGVLANTDALIDLNFGENKITDITNFFQKAKLTANNKIASIDFSHNYIKHLNSNQSFLLFSNLENILLNNNKITTIDNSIFVHNIHLKNINLENNKIAVLHEQTFDGLVNLDDVNTNNNPLSCCQSLSTVSKLLKQNNIMITCGLNFKNKTFSSKFSEISDYCDCNNNNNNNNINEEEKEHCVFALHNDNNQLATNTIIAVVVSVVVGLIIIIIVITSFVIYRRKSKQKDLLGGRSVIDFVMNNDVNSDNYESTITNIDDEYTNCKSNSNLKSSLQTSDDIHYTETDSPSYDDTSGFKTGTSSFKTDNLNYFNVADYEADHPSYVNLANTETDGTSYDNFADVNEDVLTYSPITNELYALNVYMDPQSLPESLQENSNSNGDNNTDYSDKVQSQNVLYG